MPTNVETFENVKRDGMDLLADCREDFPPEYLRWVEEGYRLSALDLSRDQQVRVNFSGHPAASIPAGLAEGRLPVGMQLIGRRYADADVLAASATFERLSPWQDTYQLCAGRPR
jgi:Asp-tRNA(Asn)/Glu-tRNA(Gln) amidotransferase A subunit family amidase